MGAAISSGGRVIVCAARYAGCQNAYIIENEHNIPHVLTPCISQRDGIGLPVHAQNKRKAQRHLLSAIERHPSRRVAKGRRQHSFLALKREAWDHIHDTLALNLAEVPSRPLGMVGVVRDEQQQRQTVRDRALEIAGKTFENPPSPPPRRPAAAPTNYVPPPPRNEQLRARRETLQKTPQNADATLQVDVEIKAKNEKEAKKVAADLTPSDINKALSAAGEKFW